MLRNLSLLSAASAVIALTAAIHAQAPPAPAPADGITMDMMPISADQIASCRNQASSQLATEQDTLHKREHGQDNDQMKKGVITGVTGAATSAISRNSNNGYWWGRGSNNGANTAAATGNAQKSSRNSDNVASTTGIAQDVGRDAYSQCVAGIKGPEYINFRQTGKIVAFAGTAPEAPIAPAIAAAATPAPPPTAKRPVVDEGDGKHFILTAPGQTDSREVVAVPGNKNAFIEEVTGDKYIVLPDGTITRIPKRAAK